MSYASFLAWLLAFGPKIQQVIPLLMQIVDIFQPPAGEFAALSVDDYCESLESDVLSSLATHSQPTAAAFGDGSRLRAIFQFLANSGLLPLLVGLVAK